MFIGAAGEGKIASATRADYAAAAARVIASEGHEGKIYELAGDNASDAERPGCRAEQAKREKRGLPEPQRSRFRRRAESVGLPAGLADMLADSDVGASKGGLFDDSRTLSTLIGRPTTSLAESVKGIL